MRKLFLTILIVLYFSANSSANITYVSDSVFGEDSIISQKEVSDKFGVDDEFLYPHSLSVTSLFPGNNLNVYLERVTAGSDCVEFGSAAVPFNYGSVNRIYDISKDLLMFGDSAYVKAEEVLYLSKNEISHKRFQLSAGPGALALFITGIACYFVLVNIKWIFSAIAFGLMFGITGVKRVPYYLRSCYGEFAGKVLNKNAVFSGLVFEGVVHSIHSVETGFAGLLKKIASKSGFIGNGNSRNQDNNNLNWYEILTRQMFVIGASF